MTKFTLDPENIYYAIFFLTNGCTISGDIVAHDPATGDFDLRSADGNITTINIGAIEAIRFIPGTGFFKKRKTHATQ